ncbi:MAG: TonB-dependent receptor plug domain-containing protein [Bacteroidota bacterium]
MRDKRLIFFIHRQAFKVIGVTIILFFELRVAYARTGQCRATITIFGEDQKELIGAYVEIPEIDQKAVTDINGEVVFLLEQGASYTLKVRSMGFGEQMFTLDIPSENSFNKVMVLKETATDLEEVVVSGKSQAATVRDLPFKPQVISLNSVRAQPVPVTAILNQLPGVRIRQEGGLGSNTNIMLNGIDGKGVKVFVDGVPVYLLGGGYSINTLSPSIIDRIEVYKGTIPVEFGSDALGGVINVVTRYGNANYADLSYSYGSWNTHEASVNARKKFGSDGKYFVNIDGFYNYADNNYWMDDVDVLIPGDPNNNTQKGRARRFNDQFESKLLRLQTGIRNVKWADELMLMASYSHIDRQWQHGLRAEQPWGEPTSTQDSRNASLSWKKYGENDKWDVKITTGYTYDKLHFLDTARRIYFWDQNFITKINGGESGNLSNGTAPVLTTRTWFSRESFSYSLTRQHTLNLTALLTSDGLTIRNEVVPQEDQERLLPAQKLLKNYTGLSLASKLLDSRLTNTISAKHFYLRSSGVTFQNNSIGLRENNNFSIFGYGAQPFLKSDDVGLFRGIFLVDVLYQ